MTYLDDLDHDFGLLAERAEGRWEALPSNLHDALAVVRRHPDEHLPTLLRALAAGDQLAGRVALQALLPAAAAAVRRGHPADAAVAELWRLLATYPLERRPRAIAANLTLDLRKALGRLRAVEQRQDATVTELATWQRRERHATGEGPAAPDVIARARALGLVRAETSAILRDVYVDGLSGREVARRHGLSEPAVRQRCSQAVRRLATHRLELLAA